MVAARPISNREKPRGYAAAGHDEDGLMKTPDNRPGGSQINFRNCNAVIQASANQPVCALLNTVGFVPRKNAVVAASPHHGRERPMPSAATAQTCDWQIQNRRRDIDAPPSHEAARKQWCRLSYVNECP